MKGAVSAHKALQGSETEMRELLKGTEKNDVLPHEWSDEQFHGDLFYKKQVAKNAVCPPKCLSTGPSLVIPSWGHPVRVL